VRFSSIASLLFLLLLLPATGTAQLRLIPQVGLYAPVSELSTDLDNAREIGRRDSSLALGLALDIAGRGALGLRLGGLYATNSDVPLTNFQCNCDARSTVLTATGAAVLRPLPEILVVRPYGVAGAGFKRYDFSIPDDEVGDYLRNGNDLTLQLGAGIEFNLGLLRASVELSDYISSFEARGASASSRQHDFFLTLGFILGG